MSARYEGNPLSSWKSCVQLRKCSHRQLTKAKERNKIALGYAIYGNDLQDQGRACGNIGNIHMSLKEPVKAIHYYTETLRLSIQINL